MFVAVEIDAALLINVTVRDSICTRSDLPHPRHAFARANLESSLVYGTSIANRMSSFAAPSAHRPRLRGFPMVGSCPMSTLRAVRESLVEVSRRYSRVAHEVEDLAHDIILSALRRGSPSMAKRFSAAPTARRDDTVPSSPAALDAAGLANVQRGRTGRGRQRRRRGVTSTKAPRCRCCRRPCGRRCFCCAWGSRRLSSAWRSA